MFDEKIISEYKSIKAPEELYGRIMNSEATAPKKSNIAYFGSFSSIAAGLAIIVASLMFFFGKGNEPVVYLGSEMLTSEVAVTQNASDGIMLVRSFGEINCELTFEIEKKTEISLSDGFLFNSQGEIILSPEETKEFSEKFSAKWTVPMADENEVYEIQLSDEKSTYFIKLYFDRDEGQWTASLTK